MRAILLTAAVVFAVALPAVAQAQGRQGNSGYQDEQDNDRSSAPMWRGGGPQHWHDDDDDGQWGDMGRRSGPQHMREMMMMRMASGLGAGTFYRFKRGDDEVDIRCAPREQLQDCVNGATQLMKALPPGGAATAPGQTQH